LRSSGGLKSSSEVENFREIFAFFGKTTSDDKIFKILVGKFTSRHRSTFLCAKFVKIVRREIGEIVHSLGDKKQIKFRLPLKLSLLRGSRQMSALASPLGSQYSKFHPNRFTFGGVIAERVNIAKTRRKMNSIFG